MYDRLMQKFAIISIIILVVIIGSVILFAQGKEKVYVSLDNYALSDGNSDIKLDSKELLSIHMSDLEEADLAIPLLPEIVEQNISVESDYRKHIIYITIDNIPNKYFEDNFVTAQEGFVSESYCEYKENQITLEINLNDLYENEIVYKNEMLLLTFYKPKDLFDNVILINIPDELNELDDRNSQLEPEESALEVARRIKSLFSNSDTKVYLLKTKEEPLTIEDRIKFVEELKPDMTIIIDAAKGNTALQEGIATYYNDIYFIPFFGNEQFADYIEYYTLKETEASILGIFPSDVDDVFLHMLEMPSAKIDIGYITNEKEKNLLKDEEYLNKVALGIYNGILKSYEAMEAIEVK